ncbi:MAG: DinB family protein [Chthonomonas sp.]|nr:DinB family protein [Chthonomonas sp.]
MDAQAKAIKSFTNIYTLLLKDLNALPEEAMHRKFAEKARTVADMMYEVTLVNDHIAATVRGDNPPDWPFAPGTWVLAPDELTSKEAVISNFERSSQGVLATLEAMSEEQMLAEVTNEHGPTNTVEQVRFMVVHMFYHAGQVNFIQTLLGDDTWHWMS